MYQGSCHCGQTRFAVAAEHIPAAVECNCSHCQRKGYLLWFVPRSQLEVSAGESTLSSYTFNKHVIRHQFCPNCGCAPFAFGTAPDGTQTAAINLRCLEEIELAQIPRKQVDGRAY